MKAEERIFSGLLFTPGDPELAAMKLKSHNLCREYNETREEEREKRAQLLGEILGEFGGGAMQGPIFFHYGSHTKIGKRFFANYDLTIQDDGPVTIGNDCNFGPKVTIVTPIHPMVPDERYLVNGPDGKPLRVCYAKPVVIGNDVWLGAGVVVCPGVTIGDGCVIGAGSVVTRDVPPGTFAAGNPCRVIREITEADSIANKPEILGGCSPMDPEELKKLR